MKVARWKRYKSVNACRCRQTGALHHAVARAEEIGAVHGAMYTAATTCARLIRGRRKDAALLRASCLAAERTARPREGQGRRGRRAGLPGEELPRVARGQVGGRGGHHGDEEADRSQAPAQALEPGRAGADHCLDVFESFDRDGSGTIDTEELSLLLKQLGMPMQPAEVESAEEIDGDGSGEVDFEEFYHWYQQQTGGSGKKKKKKGRGGGGGLRLKGCPVGRAHAKKAEEEAILRQTTHAARARRRSSGTASTRRLPRFACSCCTPFALCGDYRRHMLQNPLLHAALVKRRDDAIQMKTFEDSGSGRRAAGASTSGTGKAAAGEARRRRRERRGAEKRWRG